MPHTPWRISAVVSVVLTALASSLISVPAAASVAAPCVLEVASIADAEATAKRCQARVEALSQRTEHVKTWVKPDGTRTTEMSFGIARVKRGNNWVDVDLSLERKPGGGFGSKVHPVDLRVGHGSELASIEVDGQRLGFGWQGALPEPVIEGTSLIYPQVRPGVDLKVEVTRAGFETFLIVKDRAAANQVAEVTMPMLLGGSVAVTDPDGSVGLVPRNKAATKMGKALSTGDVVPGGVAEFHKDKSLVATIPSLLMWDAKEIPGTGEPARRKGIGTQVRKTAAGTELVMRPDMAYFDSPDVKYPVVLDPAIAWSRYNDQFFDTWAQNGWSSSQAGSTELKWGYSDEDGSYTAHSYLQFESSELKGAKIHGANLRLFEHHSWSCRQGQWIGEITDGVDGNTKWGAEPGWYGAASASSSWETTGYSSSCPDGNINMNVTNTIQYLANLNSNQGTIGLRGASSANHDEWKRANSAEGANPPLLTVDYNHLPWVSNLSTIGDEHCANGTPRKIINDNDPDIRATMHEPNGGQTVRAQLELRNGTGGVLWTQDDDVTSVNGGVALFQDLDNPGVAGNEVLADGVYGYRVRTWDSADWSGWSGVCEFEVATNVPDIAPVITKGTKVGGMTPVTFTPAAGDEGEVAGYRFGIGQDTLASYVPAGPDGTATIQVGSIDNTRIFAKAVNKSNAAGPYAELSMGFGAISAPTRMRDDFDGDGRGDHISMIDYSSGRIEPYVQLSTPGGQPARPYMLLHGDTVATYDKATTEYASGDFNNDGRTDLAVLTGSTLRLEILLSDGLGLVSSNVTWTPRPGMTAANTKLVVGDFNGDGKDDVCVVFAYTAGKWQQWVWTSAFAVRTTAPTPAVYAFNAPTMWWENAVSDLDKSKFVAGKFIGEDARVDIAHFYDEGGCRTQLWVQQSQTGDTFAAIASKWDSGANNWCWGSSQYVSGDYTGDSRTDIVTRYDYGACQTGLLTFAPNSTGGMTRPISWNLGAGSGWCAGTMDVRVIDSDNNGRAEANVMYACCGGHQVRQWRLNLTSDTETPAFIQEAAAGPVGTGAVRVEPNRRYQLVAQHSNMCTVISGASSANGAGLIQYGCPGGANHEFTLERVGGTAFRLHPANAPGKCMDIWGPSATEVKPIHLWDCHNGNSQRWQMEYLYGGVGSPVVVQVRSLHSGMCFDVDGVSMVNNAVINQYPCHWLNGLGEYRNQRFELRPVVEDAGGRAIHYREENTLQVVQRSATGTLHHWEYQNGWTNANRGYGIASPPSVAQYAQTGKKQFDAFARSGSNTLTHMWSSDGSSWGSSEDLGGSVAGTPATTSYMDGTLQVFARGTDGKLKHWYYAGAWYYQDMGYTIAGDPSVIQFGNQLHVFARTASGTLLQVWWNQFTWSSADRGTAAGTALAGEPTAVLFQNQLNVVVRGSDDKLKQYSTVDGTTWSSQGISTGSVSGRLGATARNGLLHVFARGTDGSLQHWSYGTGWIYEALPDQISTDPAVTQWGTTSLQVYARNTTTGALLHKWNYGNAWNTEDLGGSIAAEY